MTPGKRKKRKRIQAAETPAAVKVNKADAGPSSGRSAGRIWIFRLASVLLFPLLVFSILEIALRTGGYGCPPGFYVKSEAVGDFRANSRFGWRFFPPDLARSPEPHFLNQKSDATVRIFVLGGSAAQGVPNTDFGFPRILEVLLQARYPGVEFEVFNAAMTAINSHVVLEIARDCAGLQPDLFIVYMGNNEVIGPFGPGTVFPRLSSNLHLIRANLLVNTTRTGQFLGNAIRSLFPGGGSRVWLGMEMFVDNPVAADDPRLRAVYTNFRSNLEDICRLGRDSGAGIILSTVAVNLADCPPFASEHRADLTDGEREEWDLIYGAGVELEAGRQWLQALREYESADRIDGRYAELQYRMGACLLQLDRTEEARERFLSACDLDVLRFRADREINKAIREVAAGREQEGIRLADAEQRMFRESLENGGIPGDEVFYEHVHYNFDGNYRLARIILEEAEKSLPRLAASPGRGPMPTMRECARALTMTAWDEYRSLSEIVKVVSRPPFTNQMNHSVRVSAINERAEKLRSRLFAPDSLRDSRNAYRAALEKSPGDWKLRYRFGKLLMDAGETEPAADHFLAARNIYPWHEGVYVDLGNIEFQRDHVEESIAYYNKALEIHPGCLEAHSNLIVALARQGRTDEADAHFQAAVGIDPNWEPAYINMGNVYGQRGDPERATALFRKLLEINPGSADAWYNLGTAMIGRGRMDEAADHFRKAVEFNPRHESARINLGSALIHLGDIEGGVACYQKALAINPRNATTYYRMADAETIRGNIYKAIEYYREAAGLDPGFVDARLALSDILGRLGRLGEAVACAQEAIGIDPENAPAYYQLGNLFKVQGEAGKAAENYRNALRLRPDFVEARRELQALQ